MNQIFSIILIIFGLIIFLSVIILIVIYNLFFKPNILRKSNKNKGPDRTEFFKKYGEQIETGKHWFLNSEPEDVSIKSFDNLELKGYFLSNPNPLGTVLMVHGIPITVLGEVGCWFKLMYD